MGAIIASAAGAGVMLNARMIRSRDWASTLFVGVRLTVALTADDIQGLDSWLQGIGKADLPLHRRFVADVEIIERPDPGHAVIELLVVDD
ncbi:hypothetical protein [uncultured Sphingomonas sp.]|uniref:hypothetical protein n=1 Tax=uncultured Sphingomonas sp. TaxID=158754 RepID=UPI0035CB0E2E